MQTTNNNTNQKGIVLESLKAIDKIQGEKVLQKNVELLKAGKIRIDALIKEAQEQSKLLRSNLAKEKAENKVVKEEEQKQEIVQQTQQTAMQLDIAEKEPSLPKRQKEEKKNAVDNQTVQIQMQLENEKTEEVVIEKAKEEPKQPKEKEQKQLQSKGEKTQQFNKQNDFHNNQRQFSQNGQNGWNRQRNSASEQGFERRSFGNKEQNGFNRNQNGNNQNKGNFQNRQNNNQNGDRQKPFGNKPKDQKVVFADTSILDNNSKNKHANSTSKKKTEIRRNDESSKRKIITKNGLSELDQCDERYQSRKLKKKSKDVTNSQFIKVESAVITTEKVSVKTLSEKIGQTVASIIKKLMLLNIMANINTDIDFATAELICDEFGVKLEHKVEKSADEKLLEQVQAQENEGNDFKRSPVVTVMGHVDHGKTSLLDAIRNTHVTSGEAGGITQHIGAYTIDYQGNSITFIDTPGHEAFSAMRARGASVTDVAILVVAADDGVMPQTKESIAQIKQAGVPMIVAINKIDKSDANPDRIKQQLAELDVMPEEWGGETVMVNISARNNINIDKLLEMVLLVSEVSDLKCNLDRSAVGTVIEAKLDKGKGPVATVLVQNGTLKVGDTIISGLAVGRVRAMMDDKGRNVKTAGPSTPVSVLGLDRVPNAGDKMLAVDEHTAKQVVIDRKNKAQIEKQNARTTMSADELLRKMVNKKPYNVIVKTDVQGSYEALVHMLNAIENEEIQVVCVHGGVGAVNETDVDMAIASNAHIIAFNTKTEANAQSQAEQHGIKLDYYKVIYEVIDDIKKEIKKLLTPVYEEKVVGHCEVRVLFKISRIGTVAGCYVLDGKIPKNAKIKVKRNGEIITEANIVTLQKEKQDVKEVMAGYECGIKLEGFDAIKELDIFEATILERIER